MFKKSLFSKLLFIYTGVLVLILFLISAILQYSFQRIYYRDEFRRLENSALEISNIYLLYRSGQISFFEFQIATMTYSRSTNATVIITNLNGNVLFNSSNIIGRTKHMEQGERLDRSLLTLLNSAVRGNLAQKITSYQETGDAALTLIMPLANSNEIYGGIVISQPVQDITFIVKRINNLIWVVGSIGSVVAISILSIVSKKITTPISKLNKAALAMASGDFTKVEVRTDDEIGQLTSSFNYMGEQLAKQEENRREFLSTVSHELRTPLTSTLGFIQGMIDGVISLEEQEHYLKITVNEIKRVISLTNDLLHLERIKQGQIELHQDYFDLVLLLEECVDQLNPLFKDKSIKPKLDIPNELPLFGDRNRLKQVFVNLLDNGIRHAKTSIFIKMFSTNKYIITEISDDGAGISPDDAPYLFEKFYKADKSRTSKGSGAGLGLAIAKHLTELHGGSIEVIPVEVGAKFKLLLPLNQNPR